MPSAGRRVAAIHELRDAIVQAVEVSPVGSEAGSVSRVAYNTLRALCLTDKTFFELAHQPLWANPPFLGVLATLMPEGTWRWTSTGDRGPQLQVSMVSAKREGDWIGERYKLYAKCVRSIILLSTTELEQSWGKDFIRTSHTVINAWMQYSDQYTLFPHLRNLLPMKHGDEPQMTEGVRSAFVSCLARAPLEKFGMEIDGATWRIRDPNFKPDGGAGTISVLHSIETSLSGAVDVYTGVRGLPLALSKLHDTAILNMRYLQRLCTGFPLSITALSHLAALPNLQELSMERDCHLPPELGLGPLVIENSPFPALCILAASVSSFTSLEFLFRSISSSTLKNVHLLMHTPSLEGAPLGMERVHNILVKGPSRNALREVRYSVQARPFWSSHFSVLERAAKPFVGTGLQQLVYYRCVFLIKEYEYLGLAPLLDFVRLPSQVLPVHQENPLL